MIELELTDLDPDVFDQVVADHYGLESVAAWPYEELPPNIESFADPDTDVSTEATSRQLIADALKEAGLTQRQMEVIVGSFILDMSDKSLAEKLEVNQSRVGQARANGLKKLEVYFGLREPRRKT